MQRVELPGTGIKTSRLGFGCSSMMGALNRRDSLRTLEWAFNAGIRHFDVAPMYGYGEAEACLGEFLALHAGEVTVTTKFGIPPEQRSGWKEMARSVARPLLKAAPALKARARRAADAVAAVPPAGDLSASTALRSLERSLQKLRVERIDLFLLHDTTPDEVRGNDTLLVMLERSKAAGKIGAFGVGTDRGHADAILRDAPLFAPVVQREWSVFDPLDVDSGFHIAHRALSANQRRLGAYLGNTPDSAAEWSDVLRMDPREPGALSALMMRAALWANLAGIVLFSSKSEQHIQANAELASEGGTDVQAEAFYRLVQRELSRIPALEGSV